MKKLFFGITLLSIVACDGPKTTVSTSTSNASTTVADREERSTTNPTDRQPLYRTMEGEDQLLDIEATSSDQEKYQFSVTYLFTVKAHPKPATFKDRELKPQVARACQQVIAKHGKDELNEDNFKTLRNEMYRAVNENIDPSIVAVESLTLYALRKVE